jgi:hypothetical protein
VEVLAVLDGWRLGGLEPIFEDRLLARRVDELTGRDAMLRLDDSPGLRGECGDPSRLLK